MQIRQMLNEIGLSNPYRDFDARGIALDLQGWGSDAPRFETLIKMIKPSQIIEVGTWKGASAINMARHALRIKSDVCVLCVDTWLGSNTFWQDPVLRLSLKTEHGHPTIYRQFLANVINEGLTDTLFPFPMTSLSAAKLLAAYNVQADLSYIDAAHGEYEVYGDMIHFWPLVRPGGILFGDDYSNYWSGVVNAVDRFAREMGLRLETSDGKWSIAKPR